MIDKIEETIKEIAATHGIAVGRDDPILILQTINNRLMQESAAAQQANLDVFKSELEEIAHRWGEDAKNKAERTLNAALKASKEAISATIQENIKATSAEIRQQIKEGIAQELKPLIRETLRVSNMNMIAAGMACFAAGIALWASL